MGTDVSNFAEQYKVRPNEGNVVGTMGQQDRVGAVELAIDKAQRYQMKLKGSTLVSEAFFPRRDSIDLAAEVGVAAILWPAGSMRDREIIEDGNENSLAMMVTPRGERGFSL